MTTLAHRTIAAAALAAALAGAAPAAAQPPRAAAQPAQSAVPPAPSGAPAVDHHQHLLSAAEAASINGPELPIVDVPPHFAALLAQRAERWNDAARLEELYTQDAIVAGVRGPTAAWFRGRAVGAGFLARRFSRAYTLRPVAWRESGSLATLSGYYSRPRGDSLINVGFFQLGLRRDSGGAWRIEQESANLVSQLPQEPITADRLVAMLDEAGIGRAVVLSGAFTYGSKNMDPYRGHYAPGVRERLVRQANDWTAAEAARFPDRLVAFCSFDPLHSIALEELDRCASDGRFQGLKLHLDEAGVDLADPAHVESVRHVFAAANRHRLPIVVHVGNNQGDEASSRANVATFLGRIVTAAPDVIVQVAHLWGGQGFSDGALAAYADAMESGAPGTRNLWFDIAEAPLIASQYGDDEARILETVARRIRQIGVGRVLYGSDGALEGHLEPRDAWAQFRTKVPLTAEELRTIASNVAPYLREPRRPAERR